MYLDTFWNLYVSGYLKVSKDKKSKYFNFLIQNDETLQWAVCFSPEKHQLFSGIVKDS